MGMGMMKEEKEEMMLEETQGNLHTGTTEAPTDLYLLLPSRLTMMIPHTDSASLYA
jgi:hypothetical protein